MKRFMAALLVLCMVGVVQAQMPVRHEITTPDVISVGDSSGARQHPYLYRMTRQSGFYMPAGSYGFAGVADQILFDYDVVMTGFEFTMVSRVTAALVPFNATVAFYGATTGLNLLPGQIASYSITGLGTGLYTVSMQKFSPVDLPANTWMEVTFADTLGNPIANTGLLLAGHALPDIGNPSPDWYAMMATKGVVAGYYWNGGYTPDLPQSDPNYNPISNYLLAVNGIPEPMTLGLVALGGLLVVRRRR